MRRKTKKDDLTPDQMRLVKRVLAYAGSDDSLEALESYRREAEKVASAELDRLALELAEKEAERRKLWGKKFPRVLGQKPDEPDKTSSPAIHPVKSTDVKLNRRLPSVRHEKKAR